MIIILAVVVALAIMIVVSQRQSVIKMHNQLRQAQEKTIDLEQKISVSRDELKRNREELERGKTALKDARELSKKKLRRQNDNDNQKIEQEAVMTMSMDDNEKALAALEAQIEQLKKDQGQQEAALRQQLAEEFTKKQQSSQSELGEFKKKFAELQEELKKQKRLMRPEGNKIDLSSLPDEAAGEFARVYRKAEHHERLHGIARAKLQLAQEKFADLQKRYFSVCRELAVAVGKDENIAPAQAREVAEEIVAEHQQDGNSNGQARE
jgi:chromosome segregation ATPase